MNTAALESLYQAGMSVAATVLNETPNEYTILVYALEHVLTAQGITEPLETRHSRMAMELASLFHNPLCMSGMSAKPLAEVVQEMIPTVLWPVRNKHRMSLELTQVLERRWGFRVPPAMLEIGPLRKLIRQIEHELRSSSASYDTTLHQRLTKARSTAALLERKVEIVEALHGGEMTEMEPVRELGRRLREAADSLEATANDTLTKVRQVLADLPRYRAQQLCSLDELRVTVRDAWHGIASVEGPILSDGSNAVLPDAKLKKATRTRLLAREHERGRWLVQATLQNAADQGTNAALPAQVLGFLEYSRLGFIAYLAPVDRETTAPVLQVDARRLRYLMRETKADALSISAADKIPVVLYRAGIAVALLMPLRDTGDRSEIDLETAREN